MHRVGVVVHPTRPVLGPLETLQRWAADRGVELVRLAPGSPDVPVAPAGEVGACDLVAAIGGDGTVLTALHAAAPTDTPVLGIACGSLGALSSVATAELRAGLDRFAAGEWQARRLPALAITTQEPRAVRAINDLVLVRHGASQIVVAVSLGEDLYARMAGDGVVVATPQGSSAYSMAAGGPLLTLGASALVCTPLMMHGGCVPPVVIPGDGEVTLDVDPGHGGFDVEIDGHRLESTATRFVVGLEDGFATLVVLGDLDSGLPGLRRRGLVIDSPRVLARDARTHSTDAATSHDAPG